MDEFIIGGPEESKRGRGKGLKKLVVVSFEILDKGVGRAYTEIIEHASAIELGAFLQKYVSKDSNLVSDKWKGYTPLKNDFLNLKQIPSNAGQTPLKIL